MYEIDYWQMADPETIYEVFRQPDVFQLNVDTLQAFQTYLVQVRAYTVIGSGPISPTVEVAEVQEGICCVITIKFDYIMCLLLYCSSIRATYQCHLSYTKLNFNSSNME